MTQTWTTTELKQQQQIRELLSWRQSVIKVIEDEGILEKVLSSITRGGTNNEWAK
jgi:hypothetical protein